MVPAEAPGGGENRWPAKVKAIVAPRRDRD